MHVGIVVAEKAYLKLIYQPANLSFIEEQAWDSHERDAVVRNSLRQIELWQNLRLQQGGDQIIRQLNSRLGTRQTQRQHGEQNEAGEP